MSTSPRNTPQPGLPNAVDRLIAALTDLPGIGRRSAERIAFHLLKAPPAEALALSQAIADVKQKIRHCSICFNLTDTDPCPICSDPRRDAFIVLVVEQPRDLISLEQTGLYRGVYHVLMGRLDPLSDIGPEHLNIKPLLERASDASKNARGVAVAEIILGLNPDLEGDTTALHLADELSKIPAIRVTRLARGIPTGSQLEYASKAVLGDAIQGRQNMTH